MNSTQALPLPSRVARSWVFRPDTILLTIGSVLLAVLSHMKVMPFSHAEVFGFISGAVCVWLCVKQNIWAWPVGIVNNGFFIYLFLGAKLYADTGLQVVYVILSLWGWYMWLYGGKDHTVRHVTSIGKLEAAIVGALTAVSTIGLTHYLRTIHDSAPFLDALTTAVSLAAQYMLSKKLIQNWWLWIAADVIYVPLYFYKALPLTGLLYVVFLLMCVMGLYDWHKDKALTKFQDAFYD